MHIFLVQFQHLSQIRPVIFPKLTVAVRSELWRAVSVVPKYSISLAEVPQGSLPPSQNNLHNGRRRDSNASHRGTPRVGGRGGIDRAYNNQQ